MAKAQAATQKPEMLLDIRDLRIEARVFPPDEAPKTVTLVHDVSLTLKRGKVLGLIGESGAGKSTIGLSSMAYGRGGVKITGGQVLLNGRDILPLGLSGVRKLRGREVCYVAQSAAAAFNPAHKLMDQVVEAALLHGVATRAEAERRAVTLFKKLSLPNPETIGNRYPHQVSGGQLQRVMTAMALCSEPDLIVFDEPTTALDVTTQIDVLAAIKDAIRDTHVAALYISHDLAVVAQVADEILVLRHGRLVERGDTHQIIKLPQQDYTRALVAVHEIDHTEKQPSPTPVLSVKNVTAAYGGGAVKVLKNVSVDLHPGQTLAVVGESGSGKSTLGRLIAGLMPPVKGTVKLDGKSLPTLVRQRDKDMLRRIQIIYQSADTALNPRHTIRKILGRPLTFFQSLRGAAREQRVIELLKMVELDPGYAGRYPAQLSGGQRQRVAIARALAANPDLIICDEITSALDQLVQAGILQMLADLQQRLGVSYLFITHDLEIVRAIADRVIVMSQGRIVDQGSRAEVLSPPYPDYTKLLLDSVPEMAPDWLDRLLTKRSSAVN